MNNTIALHEEEGDMPTMELHEARDAVAELIEDMRRINKAAALGLRYHDTGPGYTEEVLRISSDALARVGGAK